MKHVEILKDVRDDETMRGMRGMRYVSVTVREAMYWWIVRGDVLGCWIVVVSGLVMREKMEKDCNHHRNKIGLMVEERCVVRCVVSSFLLGEGLVLVMRGEWCW